MHKKEVIFSQSVALTIVILMLRLAGSEDGLEFPLISRNNALLERETKIIFLNLKLLPECSIILHDLKRKAVCLGLLLKY